MNEMHQTTRMLVLCLIGRSLMALVFDEVDVHRSAPSTFSGRQGGFMRGGRYELRNATMVDLIGSAWGIDPEKVVGGPAWLDTDRFDVIAKGSANTTPESLRLMLQALLADRFKLVTHGDTRPFPAYALKAGKRLKLKRAVGGGESGCRPAPQNTQTTNSGVTCHEMTMAQFAAALPRIAGDYFQGSPVVDLTRLEGSWDFTMQWTRRNLLASAGANSISIYDAIGKQLGLKLDVQKVPMPVLAVDSVAVDSIGETPAGNPTAGPAEFEVAVIKPSAPGASERSFRIEPGGRIDIRGFTLKRLIKFAWDFQDNDVRDNDDMLVGASKQLDTERFDVVARPAAAPGISSGPQTGPSIDLYSIHMMLRALLVDRFKLATHTENQRVTVYALVAERPRLKKADLSNRPGCRIAPAPPRANMVSAPLFSVRCQNTTMAQLAERLQPMGGLYIPHQVIDSTGLEGGWDFVLSWSPPHLIDSGRGGGEAAGMADPNGGLTLVEALEKQLGLKLKLQKYPMPVLVIDHVEEKPTDN
jgi:uncharacterized protein (TIGR03435 family)